MNLEIVLGLRLLQSEGERMICNISRKRSGIRVQARVLCEFRHGGWVVQQPRRRALGWAVALTTLRGERRLCFTRTRHGRSKETTVATCSAVASYMFYGLAAKLCVKSGDIGTQSRSTSAACAPFVVAAERQNKGSTRPIVMILLKYKPKQNNETQHTHPPNPL